ncbi:hypothetical protein J6590_046468 [Homalodisca vitripennis]|nr:hypothetical protein J6590_046468 [Homalodisca vitripennis]
MFVTMSLRKVLPSQLRRSFTRQGRVSFGHVVSLDNGWSPDSTSVINKNKHKGSTSKACSLSLQEDQRQSVEGKHRTTFLNPDDRIPQELPHHELVAALISITGHHYLNALLVPAQL